jgi:hypothetical protein
MNGFTLAFLLIMMGLVLVLGSTSGGLEKRRESLQSDQNANDQRTDSGQGKPQDKNGATSSALNPTSQNIEGITKTTEAGSNIDTNSDRLGWRNWKDWYSAFGPSTWVQWILALLAAVAAIIGLSTLSAISSQVKANEIAAKAAKESADTALAAQRPWVGIDFVTTEPLEADKRFVIKATLRNSGHSPALQWRAFFDSPATIQRTEDFKVKSIKEPYGRVSSGVLLPNATFTIDIFVPAERLTNEQVNRIESKKDTIYIFGQTDYIDSAGNLHKTLISMFYDVYSSRFGYCTEGNHAD